MQPQRRCSRKAGRTLLDFRTQAEEAETGQAGKKLDLQNGIQETKADHIWEAAALHQRRNEDMKGGDDQQWKLPSRRQRKNWAAQERKHLQNHAMQPTEPATSRHH